MPDKKRVRNLLLVMALSTIAFAGNEPTSSCLTSIQSNTTASFKEVVNVRFMDFMGDIFAKMIIDKFKTQLKKRNISLHMIQTDTVRGDDEKETYSLSHVVMPNTLEMTRRMVGNDYLIIIFNNNDMVEKYRQVAAKLNNPEERESLANDLGRTGNLDDHLLAIALRERTAKIPKVYYAGDVTSLMDNDTSVFSNIDFTNLIDLIIQEHGRK